jgi:TRAP-type C4-dicarboxylate transport system substrate-binding protein
MTMTRIDGLIWKALTNANFWDGLLNDHRREVLDAWDPTEGEREVVLAVQTDALEEFDAAHCRQSKGLIL